MNLRSFFCILTLLIVGNPLMSQQDGPEELQKALSGAQGHERVDILNRLSTQLKFDQPGQARAYAEEAYNISGSLNYLPGFTTSSYLLSIYERDAHNYRRAVRYAEEGLESAWAQRDTAQALQGLDNLILLHQVMERPAKKAEYERRKRQLENQVELARTRREISSISQKKDSTEAALTLVATEKSAIEAEKVQVLNALQASDSIRLARETELARLAQQAAELEAETALLEKEAALTDLRLEKEKNLRNIALAGAGLLLVLLLAGWQRYRFVQQRENAEAEKQRAERLEELDRLKDQFLANTSHELRTPLNGIIGIAESLYEDGAGLEPDKLRLNLSVIISAGKRLNNLVSDIMDFSQLKNAVLTLKPRPVDLHSLAEVVLRINYPLARAKSLQLVNAVGRDLPAAEADEDRLQQILHNLVSNAIKFTDEGQVTISAEAADGMLQVAVADTGIGIQPDKHEIIFEAFNQGDGSIARQYTGTGLGLSISRQLIELHGGRIWLESTEGAGSTFYFNLPLSDEKAAAREDQTPDRLTPLLPLTESPAIGLTEPAQPGPALITEQEDYRMSILIVDDEPINQHVLRNHLPANHYDVTTAMNGEEALRAIQSGKHFDLVLLDIMMPRMSGYEVCEKIREQYLPSELPVIMVTARNQVKDMVQGLQTGANDYLAKPFSRDEFLARIKTHINLNHIHKATGRFVPSAFLRSLGRENITEVQLGDQVERIVTVFFSDIRDYTRISETMTPEENFRFVNAYNRRIGPLIDQNNGFVNQYLGDAIMAIFLHSPADALQAAIEMQGAIRDYNEVRRRKQRRLIRSGIGFHTGKLIMGITGDGKRLDAATISDAVNTASRIESLNKYYGTNILLSENSLQGMEDRTAFHFRYLGKVQMKGKAVPVGIYECIDGDPADMQKKKLETLDLFEEGLQCYYEREFKKAAQAFERLLKTNAADAAAQLYLNKTLNFITSGVPDNWTGLEVMESK